MRGNGSRKVAAAVAVALFTGALIVTSPGLASACGRELSRPQVFRDLRTGALETVTLRTFHLEVTPPKAAAVGSAAVFEVVVTRPAKEDPLGQGIPIEERPYVEPVPDAIVGIGLMIGDVFLPGAAMTDEAGRAVVKIKIEKYAPKGTWVDMSVYAWKIVYETPCLTVREDGFVQQSRIFKTS